MSHVVIGGRRKTGQAKGPGGLTKEAIIKAAVELIDSSALEDFSMRNLAKALGVYPAAVYWHLPSRNALISEVISTITADITPDRSDDWQLWLKTLFRNYRQAIREHPNVAPLVGVQLVSNITVDLRMLEDILFTLTLAGFDGPALPAAYNVVIGAMVGFTTQEFAMVPRDEAVTWARGMEHLVNSIDAASHPLLARHVGAMANKAFILRWQNGAEAPLDEGFEMFIEAVVRGLACMLPLGPHPAVPERPA